jgi:hypothetical protein
MVAAYAQPTSADRQLRPRHAVGKKTRRATAAMAERRLATCPPVKDVILTAAPPVENSNAAVRTIIRSAARGEACSVIDAHHTARRNEE